MEKQMLENKAAILFTSPDRSVNPSARLMPACILPVKWAAM